MDALPPFNPDARCPKCGHSVVGIRWKVAKTGQTLRLSAGASTGASEWLMRHCERCSFNWDEACLDMTEVVR